MLGTTPVGSDDDACASRSATPWRLRCRSDDSSNSAVTTDSPGIDCERSEVIPASPPIACSTGRVTCASTAAACSPGASVWITTCAGANSGNTSRLAPVIRNRP